MMRIQRCLRSGLAVAVMIAAVGCGDDKSETSGFSGYGTYPTTQTPTTQTPTNNSMTSVDSEGTDSSTSPVDPTTGSTEVDPTTTTAPPMTSSTTTMPMTTEPPMTTSTTLPMTTDDTSTGTSSSTTDDTSSSSTTTTTMGMTTDPPPPPPKDPQPATGLYSSCWPSEMCTGVVGGGCLTLQDADMVKFDGFCTVLCTSEAQCAPKPNGPAVTKCLNIDDAQKACFLECVADTDCPTGMTCELVGLPGGDGSYCW